MTEHHDPTEVTICNEGSYTEFYILDDGDSIITLFISLPFL
jgi:hypothetical protein